MFCDLLLTFKYSMLARMKSNMTALAPPSEAASFESFLNALTCLAANSRWKCVSNRKDDGDDNLPKNKESKQG